MRKLLVAMCLCASNAQAAPIGPPNAYWQFAFYVSASDGFNSEREVMYQQEWTYLQPEGVVTSTVQKVGEVGVFQVYDVLSGSLEANLPPASFSGTGLISGMPWTLAFTVLDAATEGDPLGLTLHSTNEYTWSGGTTTQGTMRVAGLWTHGDHEIPFDTTLIENVHPQSRFGGTAYVQLGFDMGTEPFEAFLPPMGFVEDGLTYNARLGIGIGAMVPEPNTALLLALGLILFTVWRKHVSAIA